MSIWHDGATPRQRESARPGAPEICPDPLPEAVIMANTTLFSSSRGSFIPRTDTVNRAGGEAYSFTPRHALAQYAATGCLNATCDASASTLSRSSSAEA